MGFFFPFDQADPLICGRVQALVQAAWSKRIFIFLGGPGHGYCF
nr:MAG TPA: hypothetical protein [Caudoviricetes sp.]